MRPPPEIRELCQAFVAGLETVLGDKLFGVYLYGAVAFPESGSTGDIDFHVILTQALSEGEKSQLHQLHAALVRDHVPLRGALMFSLTLDSLPDVQEGSPGTGVREQFAQHGITLSTARSVLTQVHAGRWQIDDHDRHGSYVLLQEGAAIQAYGEALDGYYILLSDARQTAPPQHQLIAGVRDDSWALHCEHIRAGRCIVLHGPDPKLVYPPASWPELAKALHGELDYVEQHLDDYPPYCVLNLCRLMYSHRTRDVVTSKRAAAAWASEAIPQWRPLIEAALRAYDRQTTAVDRELLRSEVRSYFDFAREHIRESLDRARDSQA